MAVNSFSDIIDASDDFLDADDDVDIDEPLLGKSVQTCILGNRSVAVFHEPLRLNSTLVAL